MLRETPSIRNRRGFVSAQLKRVSPASLSRRLGPATLIVAALATIAGANPARAQTLPRGGHVVSGSATILPASPGALTILQSSSRAVIDWQSFSVGSGAGVVFVVPNSQAATLNRVTGSATSTLAGQIRSNGQVYLVNPNGIEITPTGTVNTEAFIATTLGQSDADFLSGRNDFLGDGSSADVVNNGRIRARPGGAVVLIGGHVVNNGTIDAPLGRVGLASGESVSVDLKGNGFLTVSVPTSSANETRALISQSGRIRANGGRVELRAATSLDVAAAAVNVSGSIEADSVRQTHDGVSFGGAGLDPPAAPKRARTRLPSSPTGAGAGTILIDGGPGGQTVVTGKLSAMSATKRGGSIAVTSGAVTLRGAILDVSGATGGGTIDVGGDLHGAGPLATANSVAIDAGSMLTASALRDGDGGQVVVWSEAATDFEGAIAARGGAHGGNGGAVEVSSHGLLTYLGSTNTLAPEGATGTLLLDPYDVTIQTNPGAPAASCSAGTCSGSASASILTVAALEAALASSNVTVTTGASGSTGGDAGNITVANAVTWSSAYGLTLTAANNIAVNADIASTGGGPISLTSTSGAISINGARVSTAGGNLTITATGAGAATALTLNGATLDVGAGAATITATSSTGNGLYLAGANTLAASGAGAFTIAATTASPTAAALNFESGAGLTLTGGSATLNATTTGSTGFDAIQFLGSNSLVNSGPGVLALVGNNTSTMFSAIDFYGAQTFTNSGGGTFSVAGGNSGSQNGVWFDGAALTTYGALSFSGAAASANGIFYYGTDSITNSSGALTVSGTSTSGNGLAFNGAVSFTNSGASFVANGVSGSGSGANFASSATLTTFGAMTLSGTTTTGTGVVFSSSNLLTTSGGALTISGNATGANADAVQFIGDETFNSSGAGSVAVNGTSTNLNGILFENNATLTTTGPTTLSGSSSGYYGVWFFGGNTLTDTSGNLLVTATNTANNVGLLFTSATNLTNNGSGTFAVDGNSVGAPAILMAGSTVTSMGAVNITGIGTGQIGLAVASSAIVDSGGALTVSGISDTYHGVNFAGTLTLTNSGTGAMSITGTSTSETGLYFSAASLTTSGAMTLSGASTSGFGALFSDGPGSLTNSGPGLLQIDGLSGSSYGVAIAADLTASGAVRISGTSTSGNGLYFNGGNALTDSSGGLTLTGTSTSNDGVWFNGGTDTFSSGAGAVFAVNGVSGSGAGVSLNMGTNLSTSGMVNISGVSTSGSGVSVNDSSTLTDASGDLTITGSATSGVGVLLNTAGLANNGGTFALSGTGGGGADGVQIASGATLSTSNAITLTGASDTGNGVDVIGAISNGAGLLTLASTSQAIVIASTGGLTGAGTGAFTLQAGGAATIGGAIATAGGAISIAGSSISGAGDIGGGAVWLTTTGPGTLSGTISGAGGLTLSGGGTETLAGANTYTGSTAIDAGALRIGDPGSLGSGAYAGAISIASGATFAYSSSATQTLSGVISGGGAVTKDASASTLTLTNANSYGGGTNIEAGVLNVGALGAIGSTGTISFGGGTLQYSAANQTDYSGRFSSAGGQPWSVDTNGQTIIFASALSGAGSSLTKLGAGTLTLTSANAYSGATIVGAGTLQVGGSGSLGSGAYGGDVVISNGAMFEYSSITAQTISGAISGAGAVIKDTSSASALTLSGADTYTGATIVDVGALTISNSWNVGSANTGTISVASGATLNGAGAVTAGTLAVAGAGTVDLTGANQVGAISSTGSLGSFTFNNAQALSLGSITASGLIISTTGATSDLTLVSGATLTSTLGGAGVSLVSSRSVIDQGAIVTNDGPLTISAPSAGVANAITLSGAAINVGAGTGIISGTAASGNGLYVTGTNSLTATGAGSIQVMGASATGVGAYFNAPTLNVTGAVAVSANSASNVGLLLNGATLANVGAVTLGISGTGGGGADGLQIASGAVVNTSGAVTLTGASDTGYGVDVIGAVSNGAGLLTLASASQAVVTASTGALTGAGTGAFALTGASVTIGDAISTASGAVNVTGPTTLSANVTTTGGAVTFNSAAALGGESTISTSGGPLFFSSTLDGARSLTVDTGTGATTFSGVVGGVTPLFALSITADSFTFGGNVRGTGALTIAPATTALPMHIVDGITTGFFLNAAEQGYIQHDWTSVTFGNSAYTGAMTLGAATWGNPLTFATAPAGRIVVAGAQASDPAFTFAGPTTLDANVTSGSAPIAFEAPVTLGANVVVNAGSATTNFASTIDGAFVLTLAGSGFTTFGGAVGGTTPIGALYVSGPATLDANIATANGAVTFSGAAALAADVAINSGSAATNFASTIDGAHALALSGTGGAIFGGALGGSTPIGALSVVGPTTLSGNVTTDNAAITLSGATTLGGDVTINAGMATTRFASAIDGAHTLALTGTGATTFGGAVGGSTPLGALSVTGPATLYGNVTTNNASILFARAVTLEADATLASGTAPTTFASVDGGFALAASAGSFTFNGALGATASLGAVSLTSANALTLPSVSALSLVARATLASADLSLGAGTVLTVSGSNDAVVLEAGRAFLNSAGAGAIVLTGSGAPRWLIYSNSPSGDVFGGLASGNTAIWNTAPGGAVSQGGDRYAFAYQPTLTFASVSGVKAYGDDATTAVAGDYTVSGFQGSAGAYLADTAASAYTGSPVVTSSGAAATAPVTSVPYPIVLGNGTLVGIDGYAIVLSSPGALTVSPRPITITAKPQSMTYGDAAPTLTYAVGGQGLVNGDALSGALATAASATQPIGSYPITLGSLAASANYAVSYVGANLAIGTRPLTITANPQSMTYGDAAPTLTYVVGGQGLVNGDALSGALATAASATRPIGSYPITLGSLAASANYAVNYVGANVAIGTRPITITANPQSMTYGDAAPTLTYAVGGQGLVNGDALSGALATAASATQPIGSYPITLGSLAASANYSVNYVGANVAIGTRPITITANPQSMTYGDAAPTLTYAVGGQGLVNGDALSGALATAASATQPIGSYPITLGSLAASANYAVNYVGANVAIGTRPITITANPQSMTYGDATPTLTYAVGGQGLVNGDALSGALATAASATQPIGSYPITLGSLAASANYSVNYVGANLAIGTRPLTITANPQSMTYGDAAPTLTYAVGGQGLVNGDALSGALATAASATQPIGSYPIMLGSLAASANYAVNYIGANVAIETRPITITANTQSITYGDAAPTLTYVVGGQGLVNGDALSGSLATAASATQPIGSYPITLGSLAASANYAVNYIGANVAIETRPLAITANPQSMTYGDAATTLSYAVGGQGLVNGDALSGALATAASATRPIGSYPITLGSLAASSDYVVNSVWANVAIGTRPLAITANPRSLTCSDAAPTLTYAVGGQGLVNCDAPTGSLLTTASATQPIGSYLITQGSLRARQETSESD